MNPRDVFNKFLAGRGSRIERSMPIIFRENVAFRADFDFLLQHEIFRNGGKFAFVQIGANDGVSRRDDIYEYIQNFKAEGIMVEPQVEVYKTLAKNFEKFSGIKTLNKAVHATKKRLAFYYIAQESLSGKEQLPPWAKISGVASFDKEHVVEHARRMNIAEDGVKQVDVDCITPDDLLSSYEVDALDLLKVDTEGYDYEILKMLSVEKTKPTIIRFEHLHMSQQQYEEIIKKLIKANYRFIADKMNTTAYRYTSPIENR